jgi:Tfp pilus assembly PilM family ATPase
VFGSRDKTATGIHIVDNILSIVEVGGAGEKVELHALIYKELPGPFEPGRLGSDDGRQVLTEALEQVRQERGIAFKNPVVALQEDSFYLKRRPLVEEDEKANREHLLWETRQFLADESGEYGIDFALTRHCGFAVAAHRRMLELYMEVFIQAGVKNLDFDIPPFALYNALEVADLLSAEQPELVLDVARSRACALLLRDGEIDAVSICAWDQDVVADARFDDLKGRIDALLEEGDEEERPQHIWIAGAAASEGRWSTDLPAGLSMAVDLLDPFRDIDTASLEETDSALLEAGSGFAVPAGLAFRGLFS